MLNKDEMTKKEMIQIVFPNLSEKEQAQMARLPKDMLITMLGDKLDLIARNKKDELLIAEIVPSNVPKKDNTTQNRIFEIVDFLSNVEDEMTLSQAYQLGQAPKRFKGRTKIWTKGSEKDRQGKALSYADMLACITRADDKMRSEGRKPRTHEIHGKINISQDEIVFDEKGNVKNGLGSTSSLFCFPSTDTGFSFPSFGSGFIANGLACFNVPFFGYWICEISSDEMINILLSNAEFQTEKGKGQAQKIVNAVVAHDHEWNNGKHFMR